MVSLATGFTPSTHHSPQGNQEELVLAQQRVLDLKIEISDLKIEVSRLQSDLYNVKCFHGSNATIWRMIQQVILIHTNLICLNNP